VLKTGILHPQLARVLAEIGHNDLIVIGDAGLPIPKGVERIDLGWKEGSPRYLEVLLEIEKYIVIEGATFAKEAKTNGEKSLTIHEEALKILPSTVQLEYVSHVELKEMSKSAKAIILTGEFTGYTNVILRAGCAY